MKVTIRNAQTLPEKRGGHISGTDTVTETITTTLIARCYRGDRKKSSIVSNLVLHREAG